MTIDLFGVAAVIASIMSPLVVVYTARQTNKKVAAVKEDVSNTHDLVNSKADEQARIIKALEAEVRRLQIVGTSTPPASEAADPVTLDEGSVTVRPFPKPFPPPGRR